jgi:hypothetical protein
VLGTAKGVDMVISSAIQPFLFGISAIATSYNNSRAITTSYDDILTRFDGYTFIEKLVFSLKFRPPRTRPALQVRIT